MQVCAQRTSEWEECINELGQPNGLLSATFTIPGCESFVVKVTRNRAARSWALIRGQYDPTTKVCAFKMCNQDPMRVGVRLRLNPPQGWYNRISTRKLSGDARRMIFEHPTLGTKVCIEGTRTESLVCQSMRRCNFRT